MSLSLRRSAAFAWLLAAPLAGLMAQSAAPAATPIEAAKTLLATERYLQPPAEVARLVTAPRHLNVALSQPSPDRLWFLKEESEGLPSVTSFGKPHLYFAGLQVDPKANRARSLTTRGAAGLQLIDASTGATTTVQTPPGATVSGTAWSPDGNQLAFIANFDDASHVFVAEAATGRSRQITRAPLVATLVTGVDWTADGRSIVTVLIPETRAPMPVRPTIAMGPQVRLWMDSTKSPQRNFATLLEEPFEKDLMEYYVTGQAVLIDVRTRVVTRIGAPAMIRSIDASPDGRYFRVTTMTKPFSYVVQYNSFGTVEELWDASGKVVAEVEKRPLREAPDTTAGGGGFGGRPRDGAKRGLAWMPDGQGLYYIEAVPRPRRGADTADTPADTAGARQGGQASRPDRLVQWLPPFGAGDTKVLYTASGPISDAVFTDDAKTVFLAGTRNGVGEIVAVTLADTSARRSIVRMRGYSPEFTQLGAGGGFGGGGGGRGGAANDSLSFYQNPGAMVVKRGSLGGRVAMVSSDGGVFLTGTRYHKDYLTQPPRVFVDKVTIGSGAKSRVYESDGSQSVRLTAALDDDLARAIVIRESATEVPNSYLLDTKSGGATRLTNNQDYMPEFTKAVRKRLVVTRADGIKFVVRVTLPANYQAGTRLPGMLWLYPYEYTDQAGYDRSLRTEDVNRFPAGGPRTIEYLVTQGYAVANFNPPIIGEQGRMNDNYVSDLRMNLAAVIDELDRQGFVDRSRMAIGGHSYGAFSTANALVHTPFFKAGIAGDGMYNRTLTPNGFQSERRDLWDGQRTYLDMSPMLYVDKMQGALLMYHSMEDQNVGTHISSSIRMMQALRAHGKPAALFMYPYEDHGPATSETLLDQWARWVAWLDLYVKYAGGAGERAVSND